MAQSQVRRCGFNSFFSFSLRCFRAHSFLPPQLAAALAQLEASIDTWTLPDVGAVVAELGGDDGGSGGK
jgi:hypothetical protein